MPPPAIISLEINTTHNKKQSSIATLLTDKETDIMTVKIKITESVDARDARLAKASRTLAQACKAIVTDAIDHDYLLECGEAGTASSLHTVYNSEYGSYNGTSPKACKDYLQGLPSVCTVPFWNDEILELLAAQGISRKSEAAKDKLIEEYWLACGYQFWMMIK